MEQVLYNKILPCLPLLSSHQGSSQNSQFRFLFLNRWLGRQNYSIRLYIRHDFHDWRWLIEHRDAITRWNKSHDIPRRIKSRTSWISNIANNAELSIDREQELYSRKSRRRMWTRRVADRDCEKDSFALCEGARETVPRMYARRAGWSLPTQKK